jgi:small subunit ribosomal protein S6
MMKNYEAVIFIKPTLSEQEVAVVTEKVRGFIGSKGTITHEEKPEKKTTAFRVRKVKEAYYYIVKFTMESTIAGEVKDRLKLTEEIVRSMVIRVEEKKKKPKKVKKADAEKAKVEPAAEQPAPETSKPAEA